MVDQPAVLVVRDGSTPPIVRIVGGTADGSAAFYPAHSLRVDGAAVGAAAPLPVGDSAGNAALGTPADTAWTTGSGTLVGLLKALAGFLASLVTNTTGASTAALQTTGNTTAATTATALGAPADAAWSGTGSASVVAALKALWTALTGTLTVKQASFALTNSVAGTVGTTAAIIVPFSSTRKWLMITNRTTGTEVHDIGSSNVLVGSGIPLIPGSGFLFSGAGAAGPIYGITGVSNSPFSYVEG